MRAQQKVMYFIGNDDSSQLQRYTQERKLRPRANTITLLIITIARGAIIIHLPAYHDGRFSIAAFLADFMLRRASRRAGLLLSTRFEVASSFMGFFQV